MHRRRAKSFIDERMHIQKMFELNREIQKYKQSLENIRPKTNEFKSDNASYSESDLIDLRSENDLIFNTPCHKVDGIGEHVRPQSCMIDKLQTAENVQEEEVEHKKREEEEYKEKEEEEEEKVEIEVQEEESKNYINCQLSRPLSPFAIPSQCLIDESYDTNGIDVDNSIEKQLIKKEPQIVSPCSSTQTEHRTMISPKPISREIHQLHEDFELIIKPTIMVNIQDTIQPNSSVSFDCERSECNQTKPTSFVHESKIAVNQHMSIMIKKLTGDFVDKKSTYDKYMDESTEGNEIIRDVFEKKSHENFLILQKYFLRWVHFNTIEKLKRRNPAQTRLQKMEAFLQNITLERKRALNKLRRPGNLLAPHQSNEYRQITLHNPNAESPRLLIRTYNNK